MKVYIVYRTVQYEDAFRIVGVFDDLRLAVGAVYEVFGHEIKLDQDLEHGIVHRWKSRWGDCIEIDTFEVNAVHPED